MQIYLVGGCVRDELLGIKSKDKDFVVVNSSVQEMLDAGFKPVGRDFPVFLHPKTKEEYALARTERKISAGYHGFEFYADKSVSLEEDLKRRDLTINAMAKNAQGEIFDFFNSKRDLENRILRHVSLAFTEDPLRVLRLARFYAQFYHLGFSVHASTKDLCRQIVQAGEIQTLSKERIWQETHKALTTKNPSIYFAFLQDIGCLQVISADLDKCCTANLKNANLDNLANNYPPEILFAHLTANLPAEKIAKIADDLLMPKIFFTYAKNASFINKIYQNKNELSAEFILEICSKIDFWRKSEINLRILKSFNLTLVANALSNLLNIKTNLIIAKGFKGKQIAEQLYLERKSALEKFLNK